MLNTSETLLKVKVQTIINISTHIHNYFGQTDMNRHFQSEPSCIVILVLSINQLLKKGNSN